VEWWWNKLSKLFVPCKILSQSLISTAFRAETLPTMKLHTRLVKRWIVVTPKKRHLICK